MARMSDRPRRVSVRYRGVPYSLNLVRCRRALVDRQVEGEFESMEELAQAVGISRSTASRALHLRFDEVLTPETEADDAA